MTMADLLQMHATGRASDSMLAEGMTQATTLLNDLFQQIADATDGAIVAHASVQISLPRRRLTPRRDDDPAHPQDEPGEFSPHLDATRQLAGVRINVPRQTATRRRDDDPVHPDPDDAVQPAV